VTITEWKWKKNIQNTKYKSTLRESWDIWRYL